MSNERTLDYVASHLTRVNEFFRQEAMNLALALNDSQQMLSAAQRKIEDLTNEPEKNDGDIE